MSFLKTLCSLIIGYFFGSVSFAIIIGKVFFKKDVRKVGSGNPGATNAGRAFGFTVGIIVVLLDSFKSLIAMSITYSLFHEHFALYAGIAALIGHCYPIYYHFKGGKAVSSAYGFLIGLVLFDGADPVFSLLIPCLIFLIFLGLTKMMSVASMSSLLSAFIITNITSEVALHKALLLLVAVLVIIRHRANIIRILNGKESKLSFIK